MLLAIIGTPCSGKSSLCDHLVKQHDFVRVVIGPRASKAPDEHSRLLVVPHSTNLLDLATRYWRTNFVTTDLRSRQKLVEFLKRPFVAVINVSAPVMLRFERHNARLAGGHRMSLEEFVRRDDEVLYGSGTAASLAPPAAVDEDGSTAARSPQPSPRPQGGKFTYNNTKHDLTSDTDPLASLLSLATVTIHNPFSTFDPFFSLLSLETLSNALRPSWDAYFMLLASLASMRSNCMKRRVGAVLVRDKRVVSTGYNGTPRGVKNCAEGGCARCNSDSDGRYANASPGGARLNGTGAGQYAMGQGLEECVCLHAEENALLEAGRERVSGGGTTGAILYCNTCPCLRCTVKIVQCGVTEVVYSLSYSMDDASRSVLTEAGIGLRQIEMPPFP